MPSVKGLIQVTGVYKTGEIFMDEKKCPFIAETGKLIRPEGAMIEISLFVPIKALDSVLAGLASGADLTLDNVPTLLDQEQGA